MCPLASALGRLQYLGRGEPSVNKVAAVSALPPIIILPF
jgi:hypothetical protein